MWVWTMSLLDILSVAVSGTLGGLPVAGCSYSAPATLDQGQQINLSACTADTLVITGNSGYPTLSAVSLDTLVACNVLPQGPITVSA